MCGNLLIADTSRYTQQTRRHLSSTFGGSGSLDAALKSNGAKRASAPSPEPVDCTEVEVVSVVGCMSMEGWRGHWYAYVRQSLSRTSNRVGHCNKQGSSAPLALQAVKLAVAAVSDQGEGESWEGSAWGGKGEREG